MPTISLCMIVKNEERVLGRCLESVHELADEIVIVDTGSSDKTKNIAGLYNAKIYDFPWIDDFAAARNFSFSKATMDYIFWLDADDILTEQDRAKLHVLKNTLDSGVDVVMMKYNLGSEAIDSPGQFIYRERLLKREKQFKWCDPVHEYLFFNGKVSNSDICVTHLKQQSLNPRNLLIFEKLQREGHSFSTRQLFYFARELFANKRYTEAVIYYKKYLDSDSSHLLNFVEACIDLSKCYLMGNNRKEALLCLFTSFAFDIPRAEVCCLIGYLFKEQEDYRKAVYWFELAASLDKPTNLWGVIMPECWGPLPHAELAHCYLMLNDLAKVIEHSNLAAKFN